MTPVATEEHHRVTVVVNGERREVVVPARRTLADLLRDDLGLTGTHLGCEQGACGACTVLVDGQPARGCLMLAVQVDGARVETVEGVVARLGSDFVESFVSAHAFQCGFCSPGVLVTTAALVDAGVATAADEEDPVGHALAGHLCRCTGYTSVLAGMRAAIDVAMPTEPS